MRDLRQPGKPFINNKTVLVIGLHLLLMILGSTSLSANADTTRLGIQTAVGLQTVNVEVATTPEAREHGLMERTSLKPDSGMLFVYEGRVQPGDNGYWMFHTKIGLDIAFIGSNNKLVATFTMPPCHSVIANQCTIYRPRKPYIGALEMPAGYFKAHHIQVGDTLQEGKNLLD